MVTDAGAVGLVAPVMVAVADAPATARPAGVADTVVPVTGGVAGAAAAGVPVAGACAVGRATRDGDADAAARASSVRAEVLGAEVEGAAGVHGWLTGRQGLVGVGRSLADRVEPNRDDFPGAVLSAEVDEVVGDGNDPSSCGGRLLLREAGPPAAHRLDRRRRADRLLEGRPRRDRGQGELREGVE